MKQCAKCRRRTEAENETMRLLEESLRLGDIRGGKVLRERLLSFQKEVFLTAKRRGWHDKEHELAVDIALMHSELSEALEADRVGNPASEKIPGFSCVEEEFADIVLRIFDVAELRNLDVVGAIFAKAKYNEGRDHKHGGKRY